MTSGTGHSGPPLLEAMDLGKRFGGLEVLRRVHFAVHPGEIVALIGPNGAGKTTLFNMVSGLVRPSRGTLRLGGRDITKEPPHRIARLGVGRTFQTPRPFAALGVLDNLRAARLFAAGDPPAVDELLELSGLREAVGLPISQLTAVSRKRLELAMALAGNPRLLLLDEILGGLTPAEARALLTTIERVRTERRTTVFWIDHVLWAVLEAADRVIVIHHGEVLAEGPPAFVARDQRVVDAYLGAAPGSAKVETQAATST